MSINIMLEESLTYSFKKEFEFNLWSRSVCKTT